MTARLGVMLEALWPARHNGKDLPYSKIGATAKAVGGASRLAHLMWQANGYRVTGDPLDYVRAMHKRSKDKRSVADTIDDIAAWAEEQ
jgi:hypothetical protein